MYTKDKKIIIFGLGSYQNLLEELIEDNFQISYYVDNDKNKHGLYYRNKQILDPENIRKEDKSNTFIIVGSSSNYDKIAQQLKSFGLLEHIHFTNCHAVIMDLYTQKPGNQLLFKDKIKELYCIDLDMEKEFLQILGKCKSFTMTNPKRMYNLYKAIEYIVKNQIEGDIVECGVWRGGSCMVAAYSLLSMGEINRKIYMYDTFDKGFVDNKKQIDVDFYGYNKSITDYRYPSEEEVKNNLIHTGYPKENIITVKGRVQETIPAKLTEKIALLRLDTDWYESTYHELNHMYDRISRNGILIVDDYGHFRGAAAAVDQYFKENNIKMMLTKIDYSARLGIKI